MGWFGGGGSDDTPPEKGFMDGGSTDFDTGNTSMPYSPSAPSGNATSLSDFQEFSMQLQQQVLVQQVITDLSQKAFSKCCQKSSRDSALSGTEVACIAAVTNKWLDTNEFIAGRLQMKQQKQQQQHQQFG